MTGPGVAETATTSMLLFCCFLLFLLLFFCYVCLFVLENRSLHLPRQYETFFTFANAFDCICGKSTEFKSTQDKNPKHAICTLRLQSALKPSLAPPPLSIRQSTDCNSHEHPIRHVCACAPVDVAERLIRLSDTLR